MDPLEFEATVKNGNYLQAARPLPVETVRALLLHYFYVCRPYRANCQNVTPEQSRNITAMVHLYNAAMEKQGTISRLRNSACHLPQNLALTMRYLIGTGMIQV